MMFIVFLIVACWILAGVACVWVLSPEVDASIRSAHLLDT